MKEYPEGRNRRRHELEVELGSRLQSGPTMSLRLNDDYWRKKMILFITLYSLCSFLHYYIIYILHRRRIQELKEEAALEEDSLRVSVVHDLDDTATGPQRYKRKLCLI